MEGEEQNIGRPTGDMSSTEDTFPSQDEHNRSNGDGSSSGPDLSPAKRPEQDRHCIEGLDADLPYVEVKNARLERRTPKYNVVQEPQKLSRNVENRMTQKYLQEHCRKNDLYMTPR